MAKASWNTVSPASGTGNVTVTTGASTHTGRASRSSTLTIAASGATNKTVTVRQEAVDILRHNTPAIIPGAGDRINVTGISNAPILTFAISGTGFTIDAPLISTDDGRSWTYITSGTAISGDPGTAAAYQWKIPVAVTENTGINQRTATLTVAAEKEGIRITLTQEANRILQVS
jgi:hypothetical protein